MYKGHPPLPIYLHFNLSSGELGGLEFLHQQGVDEEVTFRCRQSGEQLVFQELQLNLKHVLLFCEFTLQRSDENQYYK